MSTFPPAPAHITISRRIEWVDTDAAGIYHWTTVMRLAEAAEAALHTALEIASRTFGVTPRVSVALSFIIRCASTTSWMSAWRWSLSGLRRLRSA